MSDGVWVCSACRSVNARRSDQCYSCHAWRRAVAVAPDQLPTVGSRTPPPILAGHPYRSSWWRALLAEALIVAVGIVLVVAWWDLYQAMVAGIENDDPALMNRIVADSQPVFVALPVLVAATLVAWAAWISRVVDNLPALGAGYSRVTPRMAFLENVLPGVNFMRLPARVREVTRLLHPGGGGDNLIVAAWLTIYVGWAIVFLVLAIGVRILRFLVLTRDLERMVVYALAIPVTMTAIGLVVVIGVLYRVERLADERAGSMARAIADAALRP